MCFSACSTVRDINGNAIDKQDIEYVKQAEKLVKKQWKSIYSKNSDRIESDGMFDIFNTRIIKIKENDNNKFKDLDAVVEFDIFTDKYGSAPYYANFQSEDTVVFYKDGSTQLSDYFTLYRAATLEFDYSDVIDSIIELGGSFNTKRIKTVKLGNKKERYIIEAIDALKFGWEKTVRENKAPLFINDGTLRIVNTKLLMVDETSAYPNFDKYYRDIEAIVEFELYCDWFGSAPYYVNVGIDNTVIFHKDGTSKLTSNYVRAVGIKEYNYDFSDIFYEIYELGSTYNEDFNLSAN